MTFDAGDIVRLVLWVFLGALLLSLVLAIALNRTAKGRAGWSLAVLVFFGGIIGFGYYKLIAHPRQLAQEEARKKGLPATADERNEPYVKAKALFDERCKRAGEKIYKTVDNVEGVLLLNVRAGVTERIANEANPYWSDAGLPQEMGGDEYIATFLQWEHYQDKRNPRGYLSYARSDLPGYRYVDVKSNSGPIYRYALSDPGNTDLSKLSKTVLAGKPARYAVSFANLTDPDDREMWVAGTTVQVTDTQRGEVMATSTWYSFEPGLGSKAGSRQPWRFARTCPELRSWSARAPTRFFVDRILKPRKEEMK